MRGVSAIRGVPYWGPCYKRILLFGDLHWGSLIFAHSQMFHGGLGLGVVGFRAWNFGFRIFFGVVVVSLGVGCSLAQKWASGLDRFRVALKRHVHANHPKAVHSRV